MRNRTIVHFSEVPRQAVTIFQKELTDSSDDREKLDTPLLALVIIFIGLSNSVNFKLFGSKDITYSTKPIINALAKCL